MVLNTGTLALHRMDKQFVVVEFIREQSVGVVHCSWVEHDKQVFLFKYLTNVNSNASLVIEMCLSKTKYY